MRLLFKTFLQRHFMSKGGYGAQGQPYRRLFDQLFKMGCLDGGGSWLDYDIHRESEWKELPDKTLGQRGLVNMLRITQCLSAP
jgi:hypothetical protein